MSRDEEGEKKRKRRRGGGEEMPQGIRSDWMIADIHACSHSTLIYSTISKWTSTAVHVHVRAVAASMCTFPSFLFSLRTLSAHMILCSCVSATRRDQRSSDRNEIRSDLKGCGTLVRSIAMETEQWRDEQYM